MTQRNIDAAKIVAIVKQHSPTKSFRKEEWRFVGEADDLQFPTHCVCGHSIANVVWISLASDPKRVLHLGRDCFGRLEVGWGGSPLSSSASANKVLKASHAKALQSAYSNFPIGLKGEQGPNAGGSWDHWLKWHTTRTGNKISVSVRAGVVQLTEFGFILDERLLEACVEYYNHNRKFDAVAVLGKGYASYAVNSNTKITIAAAMALLARGPSPVKVLIAAMRPTEQKEGATVPRGNTQCKLCTLIYPTAEKARHRKFCSARRF